MEGYYYPSGSLNKQLKGMKTFKNPLRFMIILTMFTILIIIADFVAYYILGNIMYLLLIGLMSISLVNNVKSIRHIKRIREIAKQIDESRKDDSK